MLTTKEAAEMIGVAEGTIRYWRHQGRGPTATRTSPSGRYRYHEDDVEAWIMNNQTRYTPTR